MARSPKTTSAKKEAKAAPASGKPVASEQAIAPRILRRVRVTEKGNELLSSQNTVVFEVQPTASKGQIKQAVFEAYGVRPSSVRTLRVRGKSVRFGRSLGRRRDWKKALVTLPKGQSLPVHESV